MTRPVPLVLAAFLLAAPAWAQQKPELKATTITTPEDLDALTERLERLVALKEKGALSQLDLEGLRSKLIGGCTVVVVSGELDDVPLSEALLAVTRAAATTQRRGPSLVFRQGDLEQLAALRVSASFSQTRAVDAVRALLRSQEMSETLAVEHSEDDEGVFVVSVHRYDQEEDPPPGGVIIEPAEEPVPGGQGHLGISGTTNAQGHVEVTVVEPASSAERHGLRVGDVVTAIDGADVTSFEQLRAQVRAHQPGDDVVLDVVRGAQRMRVLVTLGQAR